MPRGGGVFAALGRGRGFAALGEGFAARGSYSEGMVAAVLRWGGLVGRHAGGVTAKETTGGSYHDAAHWRPSVQMEKEGLRCPPK